MFTVKIGNITRKFAIWEDARAFAEKESWSQAKPARIYNKYGDMSFIQVP